MPAKQKQAKEAKAPYRVKRSGTKRAKEELLLKCITLNPKIMAGKPVIKGTRLTVDYILNLLAHGATEAEILQEYKGLTQEDIHACLLFASQSLQNTLFMPLMAEA
jgi:uncharacterized protein (DUF433 family)